MPGENFNRENSLKFSLTRFKIFPTQKLFFFFFFFFFTTPKQSNTTIPPNSNQKENKYRIRLKSFQYISINLYFVTFKSLQKIWNDYGRNLSLVALLSIYKTSLSGAVASLPILHWWGEKRQIMHGPKI